MATTAHNLLAASAALTADVDRGGYCPLGEVAALAGVEVNLAHAFWCALLYEDLAAASYSSADAYADWKVAPTTLGLYRLLRGDEVVL